MLSEQYFQKQFTEEQEVEKAKLENEHKLSIGVFGKNYRTNEDAIPLASASKAIMGFSIMLFLYNPDNSYLLEEIEGETRKGNILPYNVTIGQLLEKRKENIEKTPKEERNIILENKLKDIDEWLKYVNENSVFANTTVKSLLNHTSQMSNKDLELNDLETSNDHAIVTKKFIEFLKGKNCFSSDNSTKFRYSNEAYTLLGNIMNLMTDDSRGFIKEIDRYAEKIGVKVYPYYELDINENQNFIGAHNYGPKYEYSANENIYHYEGANCSYSAGGICATSSDAYKFLSTIADFYSGNEENPFMEFIPEGDNGKKINGSEIFDNFAIIKGIPERKIDEQKTTKLSKEEQEKNIKIDKHGVKFIPNEKGIDITIGEHGEEITKIKESSLGFYKEEQNIDGQKQYTKFSRDGVLPLFELYFELKISDKGKEDSFDAYRDDVCCGFINFAKRGIIDRGDLYKLNEDVKEEMKQDIADFRTNLKRELVNLKDKPKEIKIDVANKVCDIFNIIAVENKADNKTKKQNLQAKLEEIEKSEEPVLKLFTDIISKTINFKYTIENDKQNSNEVEGNKKDSNKLETLERVENTFGEILNSQNSIIEKILEQNSNQEKNEEKKKETTSIGLI